MGSTSCRVCATVLTGSSLTSSLYLVCPCGLLSNLRRDVPLRGFGLSESHYPYTYPWSLVITRDVSRRSCQLQDLPLSSPECLRSVDGERDDSFRHSGGAHGDHGGRFGASTEAVRSTQEGQPSQDRYRRRDPGSQSSGRGHEEDDAGGESRATQQSPHKATSGAQGW